MVMQSIEQLKSEYTDKYVKVDPQRPELARFRDVVGQVKTVNMSGRALVEFLDYHLNIGWHDIELGALTVVEKPAPKAPAEKKAEAKKAPAKPAGNAAAEAAAPAKPAAAAGGKPSTSDILAKLRGGGGAPAEAPAAKEIPVAKKPTAEAPPASPAKMDRSKMSVADMLAAARANKPISAGAAAEAAAPAPAPAAPKAEALKPAAEPAPAVAGEIKRVDRTGMSVDDMVAYCRKVDAR